MSKLIPVPTSYQDILASAERKQKLADLLVKQGITPQKDMTSWLQVLAQMVSGALGGHEERQAAQLTSQGRSLGMAARQTATQAVLNAKTPEERLAAAMNPDTPAEMLKPIIEQAIPKPDPIQSIADPQGNRGWANPNTQEITWPKSGLDPSESILQAPNGSLVPQQNMRYRNRNAPEIGTTVSNSMLQDMPPQPSTQQPQQPQMQPSGNPLTPPPWAGTREAIHQHMLQQYGPQQGEMVFQQFLQQNGGAR